MFYTCIGFFIIFHMLLDDYIAHLVETRLEKDEEQVYVKRIELLKKGGEFAYVSHIMHHYLQEVVHL